MPPLFGAADGCMVVPAPLYHNGPIVWSCSAWLGGSHVVVLPRFEAEATLAAIDRYRADTVYLVPTMMRRIWRLPEEVRDSYDMSSLKAVWHLAEPCPEWLKQVWIDWLGPERILRTVRRHRGTGRHDHHGHRMACPPRFGGGRHRERS